MVERDALALGDVYEYGGQIYVCTYVNEGNRDAISFKILGAIPILFLPSPEKGAVLVLNCKSGYFSDNLLNMESSCFPSSQGEQNRDAPEAILMVERDALALGDVYEYGAIL